MRYPNRDMLVYIALADAYAIATEYLEGNEYASVRDKCLTFREYVPHPKLGIPAGNYTDDTEMSLANTRVLLENPTPHFLLSYDIIMFANAYVAEHLRGSRRRGYSKALQRILEDCPDGGSLLQRLDNSSNKNGAAMRAVPFGAMRNIANVLYASTLQACVTHDTPEGEFSARAVALMSHFALYEKSPLALIGEYCKDTLPVVDHDFFAVFTQPWDGAPVAARDGVSVAITTVQAVVTLVSRERTLMDMLRQTINWGGDTDSVAAIAWGIASARYQNEVLPPFLYRDLEQGDPRTGVPYLRQLGSELMNRFA